ncbi:hypothetical protein [Paraburkholderia sp. J12]|uniref:hypothetical protein n=1 Tax=Paraburkholderia sp. J12 TaxID=2805432 RepID=UPI002ABE18ED|nr:hypothetical protein [Paraburkholderia sp. J12]
MLAVSPGVWLPFEMYLKTDFAPVPWAAASSFTRSAWVTNRHEALAIAILEGMISHYLSVNVK